MQLPEYVQELLTRIELSWHKNLYRNMVFKGGGVRGVAYLGALKALDSLGMIDNLERVAGTSAGAITAMLMSFRLSIAETRSLFDSLDLSKVPQSMDRVRSLRFWESKDDDAVRRLFANYGWFSSRYAHQWMEDVIARQCQGNGRATFAHFRSCGLRDLHIVASNLSRHRAEVFSSKTTPDVAVADAVRMSMSIPFFFEALQFDGHTFGAGDYYVDGGLYSNFPMRIFDDPAHVTHKWAYRDGVNWETLGLFLYPQQLIDEAEPEMPEDVWNFLDLTVRNMFHSHQVSSYTNNPVDQHRTIEISDCGISPVEFDIEVGGEKYQQLMAAGTEAVRAFFRFEDEE